MFRLSIIWFLVFINGLIINYNAQSLNTNPDLKITTFCKDDSLQLLFSIQSSELVYKRESETGKFYSKLSIQYGFQKKANDFNLLGETFLELKENSQIQPSRIITASVSLFIKPNKSEDLKIEFFDIHTGKRNTINLNVSTLCNSKSGYKIYNDKQWMANSHLQTGKLYHIELADTQLRNMDVQFYSFNQILPQPADETEIQQVIESENSQVLASTGGVFTLNPQHDGIYVLNCKAGNSGMCLYASSHHNLWTMASDLYWPALYLLNPKDRHAIQKTAFHKQDLDSIWLALCKSKTLARKVIKSYYKRVNMAHLRFSGTLPGALTDQGMTYILFGKPTQVIRYDNEESWIYGPLGSPSTFRFNFTKLEKPLCNCITWMLNRSAQYADMQESAIEAWKAGRIVE